MNFLIGENEVNSESIIHTMYMQTINLSHISLFMTCFFFLIFNSFN